LAMRRVVNSGTVSACCHGKERRCQQLGCGDELGKRGERLTLSLGRSEVCESTSLKQVSLNRAENQGKERIGQRDHAGCRRSTG